ncbi:MAG TPA: hypothetical protein VKC11_10615 [Steroidobacteraceae bacterium]|nr:hypothetical protein [Steroidobacteraceae bacterium]
MSKQTRRPVRATDRSTALPVAGLARAGRALSLATALLSFGSRFVPLGDNRLLLVELAARARAARDCGA